MTQRNVGLTLIGAGVLINPWLLGWLFTNDGSVDQASRIAAIAAFELWCVLSGVALLWTRPRAVLSGYLPNAVAAAAAITALSLATVGTIWGLISYRGAHHHTTSVHAQHVPTESERQWAADFVRQCLESARRQGWFRFEEAANDGFQLLEGDRAHYFQRDFVFDDKILDPDRPEFLMYRQTPQGKLLVGFMFFTRSLEEHGPQPGGSLAQWHFHEWEAPGYCAEQGILPTGGRPDLEGRCAQGVRVTRSAEMLHVWFVDHPLGPYADAMIFPDATSVFTLTLLHPAAVHFTLALFLAAVALDVSGKVLRRPQLHTVAFANLMLAALSAVVTVAAGMAAEVQLLISHDVHQVLDTHKLFGFASLGGILLVAAWRVWGKGQFPDRLAWPYLGIGTLTAALAIGAGYYGSELVYVHGVAVQAVDRLALERYQRAVFEDELGEAPQPASHEHVHESR